MPRITKLRVRFSSPWFDLVEKKVSGDKQPHYSIRMDDYVTVLALTTRRRILLVRQFRPAVECPTLEFPGGHVDRGEHPRRAARRELLEETGHRAGKFTCLGCLWPDTGRLGNRLWAFFASDAIPVKHPPPAEPGLEILNISPRRLLALVRKGRFNHALHIAILAMARDRRLLRVT